MGDGAYVGKTLMALPGGIIREEPSLRLPGKHHTFRFTLIRILMDGFLLCIAEATNEALRKELAKTIPARVQRYKEELADAMNRYFKSRL